MQRAAQARLCQAWTETAYAQKWGAGDDGADNSGEQVDTGSWAMVYDGDGEELDAAGLLSAHIKPENRDGKVEYSTRVGLVSSIRDVGLRRAVGAQA